MIIAEGRFIELFNTLPIMVIDESEYKPQYDFGSQEDLIKYLSHKRKEGGKVYPLIWLETPITAKGFRVKTNKFKFVLATLSNAEISNRNRLNLTIYPTLVPLKDNMIKAFKKSGFTRILNPEGQKDTIHYNYGTKNIGKKDTVNKASDVWDAIEFECELELSDCPQKKINY